MKKNLSFRKRLYCSVVALLSLFAVCSNNVYAIDDNRSEDVSIVVNSSPKSSQESKIGKKAPEFTITKDGESVSLSSGRGAYVVLNFWTSSLQDRRKVDADMVKAKEHYKNADMVFFNISIDENADIAELYDVSSTPAVFIINPDGIIVNVEKGNENLYNELKVFFGR